MSTTSKAALVRQAERMVAQVQARDRVPAVLWLSLGETCEAFAARCTAARERRDLVLAVVPYGFPVVDTCRRVELPEKHFRLLHPSRKARYRVPKGGRGSAKSWSIALVIIVTMLAQKERVLCAREFQKSIAESSHKLLSDQIERLGLSPWFEVLQQTITCHNGSEVVFEGLHANLNKIRSLEGITLCWVEEAAKVSAASWEVLIPTIRTTDSEIWVNFNAEDEHDPTYDMFVTNQPPDALVEHFTWRDNPWFPAEMEAHRQYLLRVDVDAHNHVYGGECRKHSEAQILRGKVSVEHFEPAAEWDGPYHGVDWGFSQDPTVLTKSWIHERVLYVEYEAYKVGCDIDRTPELFDQVPGARAHTIRADSARPETISYLVRNGYPNMTAVDKWPGSVEDGVAHLRSYEKIVVHPRCEHTIEEASLYSFKVDKLTGDVLADIIDKHNHCIDSIRYALAPLIRKSAGQGILAFYTGQVAAEQAAKQATTMTATSPPPPVVASAPERIALIERAARERAAVGDLTPWHAP